MAIAGLGGALWLQQRPVDVRTAVVASIKLVNGTSRSVLEATGYVTARRQATVSSKITGRVAEVMIEEGQRVQANAILSRLEVTDANAELALARAQLAAAESELADLAVQKQQAERDARRQVDASASHVVRAEVALDHR